MRNMPRAIIRLLRQFKLLFSEQVWEWARILLIGAILAPGKRTITAVLRVTGLSDDAQFQNYHRVLNRAVWSPRAVSQVLLRLLLDAFVLPDAPVVFGLDDHLERRRGAKIKAKGIYRDPVRSSKSFFVKSSGLRWLCLMLLTPIPWGQRVWALPSTARSAAQDAHRLGPPVAHQVRAWLPERLLVVVADSSYAALELLSACQSLPRPVTMITRLRLDAALHEPAPPRKPNQRGRTPKKGGRQPSLQARLSDPATDWQTVTVRWYGGVTRTVRLASRTALWYHSGKPLVSIRWVLISDPEGKFEAQALLSTNLEASPVQIVEWFVMRWQLEVTFEEARAHLGIETQRQWSDLAVLRTTSVLLGLFSLVCLFAHHLLQGGEMPVR